MMAVISPCALYRYALGRDVSEQGKLFAFFGVNPSTADAEKEDQTSKKWIGFTERNGGRGFLAGNVFSYRATDVRDLAKPGVLVRGPEHYRYLESIIDRADVLVPCWGRIGKVPKALRGEFQDLLLILRATGKPILHFGLTKCGQPKHPQMLAYATPLTPMEF